MLVENCFRLRRKISYDAIVLPFKTFLSTTEEKFDNGFLKRVNIVKEYDSSDPFKGLRVSDYSISSLLMAGNLDLTPVSMQRDRFDILDRGDSVINDAVLHQDEFDNVESSDN